MTTPTTSDPVADFLAAMREAGVQMDFDGQHPIADGKLHRAASLTTKKRNLNVWYVFHADEPASGAFGDYAMGVNETWTAKRPSAMTDEERAALKQRMEDTQRQRAEHQAKVNAEAATAATAIWKASVKASPDHPYLAGKGLPVFAGLRQLATDVAYKVDGEAKKARAGSLVVPLMRADGTLASVQLVGADGKKLFLKGTAKAGNYTSVGKATPEHFIIAEGYATAARCHMATGLCGIVAFDSGNLLPVAKAIRKKYPEAKLTIASDNDRFTKKPNGTPYNPGTEAAFAAAKAVGADLAVPAFFADDLKSSDFDDMGQSEGLEAVAQALAAAVPPDQADLKPVRVRGGDEEPPPYDAEPEGPHGHDNDQHAPEAGGAVETVMDKENKGGDRTHPLEVFGAPHFRCLGVDGVSFFYQPSNVSQVIALNAASHSAFNMMRLAPLSFWEIEFGEKGKIDWNAAVNACIQACMHKRKFIPHNRVRGRGAWFEGENAVFHAGDRLVVNGQPVAIADHHSKHVYDEGEAISVPVDNPATTDEARALLSICKSLRWDSPLSAYMMAGFCVVAPVCGFLQWRPHVWVNGPAGSGKSTVLDKIVTVLLKETAHSVVGNTSEAGIRAALGVDAVPIIFDEFEPKDRDNQARIRAIMDLARVASSEADGLILKGTANQGTKGFRVRSMMVFASINTQIEGYADETRFTQLTLVPPEANSPEQKEANTTHYAKLVSDIIQHLTPDFARRLLARTILNMPTLRHYVTVFTAAATIHLGTRRLGDQVGPMLAGAYLLNTTGPLTVETALEWIKKNDWSNHSAKGAANDQTRFLNHISGYMIRHQTPEGGTWERPIGEVIEIAMGPDMVVEEDRGTPTLTANRAKKAAKRALGRYGIRVNTSHVPELVEVIKDHEAFRKILKGTEWAGAKYFNILKTIEGAEMSGSNRYFASGVNSTYVSVPVTAILGTREVGEDEFD